MILTQNLHLAENQFYSDQSTMQCAAEKYFKVGALGLEMGRHSDEADDFVYLHCVNFVPQSTDR